MENVKRGSGNFFIKPKFHFWLMMPTIVSIVLLIIVFMGSLSAVRYFAFELLERTETGVMFQDIFVKNTGRVLAFAVSFGIFIGLGAFVWVNLIARALIGPVARLERQVINEMSSGVHTPLKVRNKDYLKDLVDHIETIIQEKVKIIAELKKNK